MQFLKVLVPALALPAAGYWWFEHHFSDHNGAKRLLQFPDLDAALRELDNLKMAPSFEVAGDWSLYQNLVHCAQSIEFSLDGFPQMKAPLFQKTMGALVFSKFETQGYMRHDRNEPIPGAQPILSTGDYHEAIDRIKKAVVRFDTFEGKLSPHFAYGDLSKKQYEKAHCMHLADHLSVVVY